MSVHRHADPKSKKPVDREGKVLSKDKDLDDRARVRAAGYFAECGACGWRSGPNLTIVAARAADGSHRCKR